MKINIDDIKRYNTPVDETIIYDPLAIVIKAKGSQIWMKGKKEPYLDLIMSYSSTNFGHTNKEILRYVKDAAEKVDNIIGFNSASKVELCKKLVELLPRPGNKIPYFPVGGTKAIDAAIKLAKAYTKKDTIIAFSGAFHGYSYSGISVTDDRFVEKSQFGSLPGKVVQFPFPHRLGKNAEEIADNILDTINTYLDKNYKHIAAIIFEPIQGAAGFLIPPKKFLPTLIKIAKKHHVITICDEIQTGVCRTGTFYYINQLDIDPDIVLLSKSLAGGFYPLSAVIANKEIYDAVDTSHSGFDSTFGTNLFGIEIANNVITYIKKNRISEIVNKTGKYFHSEFKQLINKFEFIRDYDHVGMAYGYRVEAKSGDINDSSKLAKHIRREAFANHLIIQTAGIHGDHMKIAPNFFISKSEVHIVMQKFKKIFQNIA